MSVQIDTQMTVPSTVHGLRLDVALAQLFPQFSRSRLSEWIKAGAVTVNSQPCKPKDRLLAGDLLAIKASVTIADPEFKSALPQAIPLNIVYEDDVLLVINKAAGLVVHPGAGNPDLTLVNALYHHNPDLQQLPRAGIIHRLDKDTSGLLVIAKTLTAHTDLIRQMADRQIDRYYYALVQGCLDSSGKLQTAFGRHPRNRIKMAVLREGKPAITHYKPLEHFQHFTLIEVKLETGRTHQIRVHMDYLQYPIVGDPLYGQKIPVKAQGDTELNACLTGFKRQALHAWQLSLNHPVRGERLTFHADMPDDLTHLLNALRRYEELYPG